MTSNQASFAHTRSSIVNTYGAGTHRGLAGGGKKLLLAGSSQQGFTPGKGINSEVKKQNIWMEKPLNKNPPAVLTVTTSLNGPVPSLFCASTLNWYSVPGSSPGTTNHLGSSHPRNSCATWPEASYFSWSEGHSCLRHLSAESRWHSLWCCNTRMSPLEIYTDGILSCTESIKIKSSHCYSTGMHMHSIQEQLSRVLPPSFASTYCGGVAVNEGGAVEKTESCPAPLCMSSGPSAPRDGYAG
ncbi:hypothetical protein EYF80_016566 [Liparis tanakae]|uniref:Uncharacterized protein n=1 Tax=Liparis tanakae TaxID=230148 RepID=A0A4Z2I702_9TELE|nr:hypothetical protein EYF80_016566 [Liparis tanakae]